MHSRQPIAQSRQDQGSRRKRAERRKSRRLLFEGLESRWLMSRDFVEIEPLNDSSPGQTVKHFDTVANPDSEAGVVDSRNANGVIANNDEDYYTFEASVNGSIAVSLTNLGGNPSTDGTTDIALQLEQVNSTGMTVITSVVASSVGNTQTVTIPGVADGDPFWFRVRGAVAGNDANYELRIVNRDTVDAGSGDNSRASAVNLGTWGSLTPVPQQTITRPDRDYFRFTVPAGGSPTPIEATLLLPPGSGQATGTDGPTNLGLRIRDSAGNVVATSDGALSDVEAATYVVPASGSDATYYIEVYSGSVGQVNVYDLSIGPPQGTISGFKYNDYNGDGFQDLGEPGLQNWVIYLDLNNDGVLNGATSGCTGATEPCVLTDANGEYIFTPEFGTYVVREVLPATWQQSYPGTDESFRHVVTVSPTLDVADHIDFGNYQLDFGDASGTNYPTLLADDGPRHIVGPLRLGSANDGESNGQPTASADGDDLAGTDDEDGVTFDPLVQGEMSNVTVVSTGFGFLNAWLDFNDDGDWSDPGEQIFTDQIVVAGSNALTISTPSDAALGDTAARFRLNADGVLGLTGQANSGEVEDYLVTINDNTEVSVSVSPSSVAEDGTPNLVYTFSRTGLTTSGLTVNFTVGGDATNGTDYGAIGTTVSFGMGAATASVTVDPISETMVENDETVILTIGVGSYSIGTNSAATGTITDTDSATVSISGTPSVVEGNNLTFTVSQSALSSTDTVVTYGFGGTASGGSDYTNTTTTVTITAGQSSATVTVPTTDDAIVEGDETVVVTLSSVSGDPQITLAASPNDVTTGTITDNDSATVSISGTPSVVEGNNLTFTVSQSALSSTDTVVTYSFGGSATGGSDYTNTTTTVTITAGQSTATVTVPTTDDAIVEGNETVVVTLSSTAGDPQITVAASPNDVATGTITDNDAATVSISGTPSVVEGNDLTFTVSQSALSSTDTVVTYGFGGSATGGSDYTNTTTTVTITAGQSTATVTVPTTNDAIVEGDETVVVTLSSTAGDPQITVAASPNDVATGTITDDDSATVSISGTPSVVEGNNLTFTVSQSALSGTDTVVTYGFGGSAAGGSDYTNTTTTVTITAGQSSATVTVPTTDDAIVEGNETVVVTLSSVSGDPQITVAASPNDVTTGTITDNDSATVSIAGTPSVIEGNNLTFSVSQSALSSTDTVVTYGFGGSATGGSDYTNTTTTVTITAGQSTATVTVPTTDDAIVEGDETVVVTLSSTAGDPQITVAASPNDVATGTITDNDSATVSISGMPSVVEGNDLTFTVSQSALSSTDTVVTYGFGGSATGGSDYTNTTTTVTITAGQSTATVTVPTTNDAIVEGDETVVLTLSSTAGDPQITVAASPNDVATGTITDNDSATVSISGTPSVVEGNNLTFSVSQSALSSTDTVVTYGFGGSATGGSDYTNTTTTVTITAGQSSATVTVPTTDDSIVEGDETVVVTLSSTAGDPQISLASSPNDVATGTITDNDSATVSISGTPSIVEGNNLTFSVTQSALSSTDTVVTYGFGGSATGGSDYTNSTTTVTITAGQSTATVTVPTADDAIVEGDETVVVTLSSTAGDPQISVAASPNDVATGTITDNDSATVSISGTPSVVEGNNLTFSVTQSALSSTDTVVTYGFGGSATGGSDFTNSTTTVTITAGQSTATVTVPTTDDAIVEGDETVVVTLSSTAGDPQITVAASPNDVATGTITDNDSATVSISGMPSVVEGNNLMFTVSQSALSSTDTVVTYGFGGSAAGGSDYTNTTTTVTITAGQSSATVTVQTTDDSIVEGDETVVVTLSNTAGDPQISVASSPNDVATGTITDNDSATVSIAGTPSVVEGNNLTFSVSQSALSSTDTVVTYGFGGSATGGSDYTNSTTTVTITAGQSTATVTVPTADDAIVEGDETVVVTLSSTAGDPQISVAASPNDVATGTITDNDSATVSISGTPSVVEGNNLTFSVTQSALSSTDTVVTYGFGGSATGGSDYTNTTTTVTITAGSSTATVTVPTTDDAIVEGDETVAVTLSSTAGDPQITVAASPNDVATGTITDNDSATISISGAPSVVEGNNLTFTVSQSALSSTDTVVSYGFGGSATGGSDYTNTTTTVTISAGQSSATVTVPTTDDAIVEGNETVVVTLSSVSGDPQITVASSPSDAATGTITDNDSATVSISGTPSVVEGNNLTFSVSQSALSSTDTIVTYGFSGTASGGSDYTNTTTTVTIAAGQSTATVTVPTADDSVVEGNETVVVTLSSVSGDPQITVAASPNDVATGTITDNDSATVSISGTPSVAEGSDLTFMVTQSTTSSTDTVVTYGFGGSALGASDYTNTTTTVTITAGNTTATVTVPTADDIIVEASETVVVTLVSVSDPLILVAASPNDAATGTITDNDSATVSISGAPSVTEGGDLTFTVTQSLSSSTDAVLFYDFTGSSASVGTDFASTPTTITIPAGITMVTLTVATTNDTEVETDETVVVTLLGVAAGDPQVGIATSPSDAATGTITSDDAEVSVAVSTSSVLEDGATNLVYTFSRSGFLTPAITVNFSIGGDAINGTDYGATGTTVSFTTGASQAMVTVDPVADSALEPDETVILTVTSGTGYVPASTNTSVTGTIANDDAEITISVSPTSVEEDDAAGTLVYTFTRTGYTAAGLSVDFTVGGGAGFSGDYGVTGATSYNASMGTVSFAANATTLTLTVDPVTDSTIEPAETVILTVDPEPGYTAGTPGSATGTILNDDFPISGRKYLDSNANSTIEDGTDPRLSGWTIELYQDVNNNNVFEPNMPVFGVTGADGGPFLTAVTDANGRYTFDPVTPLATGRYFVREVLPSGWQQHVPASNGVYTVNYNAGDVVGGQNFLNSACNDTFQVGNGTRTYTASNVGVMTFELLTSESGASFSVTQVGGGSFSFYNGAGGVSTGTSAASRTSEYSTNHNGATVTGKRVDVLVTSIGQQFTVNVSGLTGTATLRRVNAVNVAVSTTVALVVNGGACGDFIAVHDDPDQGGANSDAKRVFVGAFLGTPNGGSALVFDGVQYDAVMIDGLYGSPTLTRVEVYGNAGDDYVRVGDEITSQQSTLFGHDGNDAIRAGGNKATINGGNGTNLLIGGAADDLITGGSGIDKIFGLGGADRAFGNDGNDVIAGGAGNDPALHGNNGNDQVSGGAGADRLDGGAGTDQRIVDGTDNYVAGFETNTTGTDIIEAAVADLLDNLWDDTFVSDGDHGDGLSDTLDELINSIL